MNSSTTGIVEDVPRLMDDDQYAGRIQQLGHDLAKEDPRGKTLERAIETSAAGVMTIRKTHAEGVYVDGSRLVVRRGFVDFFGCVPSGRMICLDGKESEIATRFKLGDKATLPDFQRRHLIMFGEAGAIAGLVIEATALQKIFWLDWQALHDTSPSIPWTDRRLLLLAERSRLIRFELIPGVTKS